MGTTFFFKLYFDFIRYGIVQLRELDQCKVWVFQDVYRFRGVEGLGNTKG